jgi:hypothetical protein
MGPKCFAIARAQETDEMEQGSLLIVAMAEKCRETIRRSQAPVLALPAALRPKHLLWMCERIQEHAENWPPAKLHRWIGFLQAGIIANRMLTLDDAKALFDTAKNCFGESGDDRDLVDHLNAQSAFEFEIGGQG